LKANFNVFGVFIQFGFLTDDDRSGFFVLHDRRFDFHVQIEDKISEPSKLFCASVYCYKFSFGGGLSNYWLFFG
jgi:hypothetical protein